MKAGGGDMERERKEEAWVRLYGLSEGPGFYAEWKEMKYPLLLVF